MSEFILSNLRACEGCPSRGDLEQAVSLLQFSKVTFLGTAVEALGGMKDSVAKLAAFSFETGENLDQTFSALDASETAQSTIDTLTSFYTTTEVELANPDYCDEASADVPVIKGCPKLGFVMFSMTQLGNALDKKDN